MISALAQHEALDLGCAPVEQLGGGVVEPICWGEAPVLGTASVDSCADLGGKHLAQLNTPLVKAVDAPDEALQLQHKPIDT